MIWYNRLKSNSAISVWQTIQSMTLWSWDNEVHDHPLMFFWSMAPFTCTFTNQSETGASTSYKHTLVNRQFEMHHWQLCRLNVYSVFAGSVDVASDHQLLRDNEVTHILNVASFNTQVTIDRGLGSCAVNSLFIYKHVSIMDLPDTDITSYFDECFAFIDSALDTGGRILVHCMAGVSRAASIVIGYLMKAKNMDFETAFNHVKAKRPSIRPNDGFMQQLQQYGCDLRRERDNL